MVFIYTTASFIEVFHLDRDRKQQSLAVQAEARHTAHIEVVLFLRDKCCL